MVLCAWGELDPKIGLISKKACLNGAEDKILVAIEEARSEVFEPNRENAELTHALGNPEHPGRRRGKGVVPWYEGFLDWNTYYRTHSRRKIEEERKRKLEEAEEVGSKTPLRPRISARELGTQVPAAAAADRLT